MEAKEKWLFRTDGAALYVRFWEPTKERGRVVIVHGLGEHGGRYETLVHPLVEAGYHVTAMDNRGFGKSGGKRGFIKAWSDFREDLHLLIQEESQKIFLYGHSLGSLIALDFALHYPQRLRGLICSGLPLTPSAISPFKLRLAKLLSRLWPSLRMKSGLNPDLLSRDRHLVAAYRMDPYTHAYGTPRLAVETTERMVWLKAHASQLTLPFLMLHGGDDKIAPPEAAKTFFDKAGSNNKKRIVYPGCFHEPHNDTCHAQVAKDVLAWLETFQ